MQIFAQKELKVLFNLIMIFTSRVQGYRHVSQSKDFNDRNDDELLL